MVIEQLSQNDENKRQAALAAHQQRTDGRQRRRNRSGVRFCRVAAAAAVAVDDGSIGDRFRISHSTGEVNNNRSSVVELDCAGYGCRCWHPWHVQMIGCHLRRDRISPVLMSLYTQTNCQWWFHSNSMQHPRTYADVNYPIFDWVEKNAQRDATTARWL